MAGRKLFRGKDFGVADARIFDDATAQRLWIRLTDPARRKHHDTA